MLDDMNVIKQYDPGDVLSGVLDIPEQARYSVDSRRRGSASKILRISWLREWAVQLWQLIWFEFWPQAGCIFHLVSEGVMICRGSWARKRWLSRLVIRAILRKLWVAISKHWRRRRVWQLCRLAEHWLSRRKNDNVTYAQVPAGAQPRMSTVYHCEDCWNYCSIFGLLIMICTIRWKIGADWLAGEISNWTAKTPEADNLAEADCEINNWQDVGCFWRWIDLAAGV